MPFIAMFFLRKVSVYFSHHIEKSVFLDPWVIVLRIYQLQRSQDSLPWHIPPSKPVRTAESDPRFEGSIRNRTCPSQRWSEDWHWFHTGAKIGIGVLTGAKIGIGFILRRRLALVSLPGRRLALVSILERRSALVSILGRRLALVSILGRRLALVSTLGLIRQEIRLKKAYWARQDMGFGVSKIQIGPERAWDSVSRKNMLGPTRH